eukprot:TRINITY_DN1624_c0_g1_i1.p1 TRINITY_DN1624_c0_g1~~TRINITY_DN1624_c0_g1_i1.p1  ORF type:complete len:389 (-),score=59.86 TRINITY_DN1624_c0_g1_i1:932-2098(-)
MSSSLHSTSSRQQQAGETALLIENEETSGGCPGASRRLSESTNSDFLFIKIVARITFALIKRFWAFSGAALLSIILFYWLYGGFFALFMVFFGVTGVVYKAGDKLLYHPDQPPQSRVFVPSPNIFNLPYENLTIEARDGTELHLFLIKQAPGAFSSAPTILFLHGNAGNIGHRLGNAKALYDEIYCNIALLEYRGYGRSEGHPCEDGLYLDAQAGLDYLHSRPDIAPNKIVVFGRSLGGAVAVDLASRSKNKDRIGALIIENTFTSIPDIARILFPFKFIKMLPVWFYKNQFKSAKKVCKITQPVLFVSGLMDKLIPPAMMTNLYSGCGAPVKRLARFPSGTHNETWTCSEYFQTLNYFLDEVIYLHNDHGRQKTSSPSSLVSPTSII